MTHQTLSEQDAFAEFWACSGFVPEGANPDHIYAAMRSAWNGRALLVANQTAAQQPIDAFVRTDGFEGYHPEYGRGVFFTENASRLLYARPVSQQAEPTAQEPERMTIDQSREYLVKFMERHFTDATFHRYIRGERTGVSLAGDFAWQMARALRMIESGETAQDKDAERYQLFLSTFVAYINNEPMTPEQKTLQSSLQLKFGHASIEEINAMVDAAIGSKQP